MLKKREEKQEKMRNIYIIRMGGTSTGLIGIFCLVLLLAPQEIVDHYPNRKSYCYDNDP